jgi:hypothetical protein
MKSTDVIQPAAISQPIANQGTKFNIPEEATGSELASIAEGFPDITMKALEDGGKPPRGQDCNGMFYLSTDQRVFLQNGGLITFNQDVSDTIGGYPSGAVLCYVTDEKLSFVKSLIDDNTNNFVTNPEYIDDTHWKEYPLGGSGSGSGLPLLSIRIAFYVDESLGLDYYLNGQLLTINSNLQGAVNELKKLKAIRPSLFCTEEEWQAEKEASDHGQVGKFVLNETAGTLRLPAVINIQGVFDLQNAGLLVEAGLPNITGGTINGWVVGSDRPIGAINAYVVDTGVAGTSQTNTHQAGFSIDASRSNPIYGNNTTVQEEAIQYPWVIRLATGQETEVNIRNDIESIVPYTLFDSKYSEAKQYNASWVLGGSTLSKSVYPTAYEAALVEYNSEVADGTTVELPSGGSYTKRGVSGGVTVKLSTDETVTEYDWKLDTVAEILTVPTLNGSEDLLSDRYDDLELKASGSTYTAPANGWFWIQKLSSSTGQYLTPVIKDSNGNIKYTLTSQPTAAGYDAEILAPVSKGDVISIGYSVGGATKSFRFIYAKSNGSLYFFVASVAQNAPLANLGRIEETKVDKNSSWGFPSNRYIDLELGASGSTYTAPANGWYYLQKKTGADNQYSVIFALKDGETTGETIEAIEYGAIEWTPLGNNGNAIMLKVPKGKKVVINYSLTGATELFRFIYAEGSN